MDELADRLAEGACLIDVREPDEYEEARVPGGVLVPLATVPANVARFRDDAPAYVICRSGARSMQACEFLAGQGVEAINVVGGTIAWAASGRPVDRGSVDSVS